MNTRSGQWTVLLGLLILQTLAHAQQPNPSPCSGPNGSRFNLEPRPNAVVQAAQSVAFLRSRASHGADLVLATATDMRAITGVSFDAFYVQRSSPNCKPDLEGELPIISNSFDSEFVPNGTPIALADPARDAFFIADIRFGAFTDASGVGILRATAKQLLNKTACPAGTQSHGSAGCFTAAAVFNIVPLNTFLSSPQIAVDQRTKGTGAGDVYAVVTENDHNTGKTSISLMACTNADLNCSTTTALLSENNRNVDFSSVGVRPDGTITIAYRSTTFPGINPEDIKFVTCKPNGAPAAPTCSAPMLVAHEKTPDFDSFVGATVLDAPYPVHTNRTEKDGKVTTFIVYDRCEAPVLQFAISIAGFCPKTDVAITSSSDGGHTWSPVTKVTDSKGQQFFGMIATDASTGTVNLAYYSTENDPGRQEHVQVFLAQIAPGTTTVGKPQLLTSAFADPHADPPTFVLFQPNGLGDRLGLAAAGTGTSGQSHAYVTFTWNSVFGTYNGVPSVDTNNHFAAFKY